MKEKNGRACSELKLLLGERGQNGAIEAHHHTDEGVDDNQQGELRRVWSETETDRTALEPLHQSSTGMPVSFPPATMTAPSARLRIPGSVNHHFSKRTFDACHIFPTFRRWISGDGVA